MDNATETEDAEDDVGFPSDIAECRRNEVGEGKVKDLLTTQGGVSRWSLCSTLGLQTLQGISREYLATYPICRRCETDAFGTVLERENLRDIDPSHWCLQMKDN